MKRITEIPGGRGSNAKPYGTENPVGWGVKLEKTLRGGGMDIFWNHTIYEKLKNRLFHKLSKNCLADFFYFVRMFFGS